MLHPWGDHDGSRRSLWCFSIAPREVCQILLFPLAIAHQRLPVTALSREALQAQGELLKEWCFRTNFWTGWTLDARLSFGRLRLYVTALTLAELDTVWAGATLMKFRSMAMEAPKYAMKYGHSGASAWLFVLIYLSCCLVKHP